MEQKLLSVIYEQAKEEGCSFETAKQRCIEFLSSYHEEQIEIHFGELTKTIAKEDANDLNKVLEVFELEDEGHMIIEGSTLKYATEVCFEEDFEEFLAPPDLITKKHIKSSPLSYKLREEICFDVLEIMRRMTQSKPLWKCKDLRDIVIDDQHKRVYLRENAFKATDNEKAVRDNIIVICRQLGMQATSGVWVVIINDVLKNAENPHCRIDKIVPTSSNNKRSREKELLDQNEAELKQLKLFMPEDQEEEEFSWDTSLFDDIPFFVDGRFYTGNEQEKFIAMCGGKVTVDAFLKNKNISLDYFLAMFQKALLEYLEDNFIFSEDCWNKDHKYRSFISEKLEQIK